MNDFTLENNQILSHNTHLKVDRFSISGFKSFLESQTIDFFNLNILSGTNSSGKSSFMQSLLLLKQTLESGNPANVFKIYGEIVKFNYNKEIINAQSNDLSFKFTFENKGVACFQYNIHETNQFHINKYSYTKIGVKDIEENFEVLDLVYGVQYFFPPLKTNTPYRPYIVHSVNYFVLKIIHIKGIRIFETKSFKDEPYFDGMFPGNFDNYVASIIFKWQNTNEINKLEKLTHYLNFLKIAKTVEASRVNDVSLSLKVKVNNTTDYSAHIADVGVGVSQVLPILVALVEATPDNLIYIEQPEIHLHPNAQYRLASIFADAVKEGKRLVIETHSSILLTGIQTAIAKGELDHNKVGFNWFELENGATKITSVIPDERGRVGDWPTDFDSVYLRADTDYLNASNGLKFQNNNGISKD